MALSTAASISQSSAPMEYFGASLVKAGSRLTVLDLSDNAFGPIGVNGLAALLESSSCYALEELRLNNNGLGITGGNLLSIALTNCYNSSTKEGKPLALKVFVAGRNRLENDGAMALAAVFKKLGSLEEIAMPQNGIYYEGIQALSDSFKQNKNLQILNLNDNTFGVPGTLSLTNVMPDLPNLRVINFGDCLLKTEGALALAKALKSNHIKLEELNLSSNEIRKSGGLEIIKAMENKLCLKQLILDENEFGKNGAKELQRQLETIGKLQICYKFNDNGDSDEVSVEESDCDNNYEPDTSDAEDDKITNFRTVTIEEFLETPSVKTSKFLESNNLEQIINRIMVEKSISLDNYVLAIMKVASLGDNKDPNIAKLSIKIVEKLFKDLFTWGQRNNYLPLINNSILVNLHLIKSEDKNTEPIWNIVGCYHSLKNAALLNTFPEVTKQTLAVFIENKIERDDVNIKLKNEVLYLLKCR